MAFETIRQLPLRRVAIDYEVPVARLGRSASERQSGLAAKIGLAFWNRPAQRLHLSIRYPHPELGSTAVGLASLERVDSEGQLAAGLAGFGPFGGKVSEPVAETALERDEIEFIIQSLIADGFFDPGEHRDGAAKLKVKIGRHMRQRRWDHVPALDRLISKLQSMKAESADQPPDLPLPDEAQAPAVPPAKPAEGTKTAERTGPATEPEPPGLIPF